MYSHRFRLRFFETRVAAASAAAQCRRRDRCGSRGDERRFCASISALRTPITAATFIVTRGAALCAAAKWRRRDHRVNRGAFCNGLRAPARVYNDARRSFRFL